MLASALAGSGSRSLDLCEGGCRRSFWSPRHAWAHDPPVRRARSPGPVLAEGRSGRLLSVGGDWRVRGSCQREGESCPTCAGGGDPLIEAVREAGIEIRLEGHGAAADKPGAVLLLRAEEVLHALLICGVGDRQAGGLQSHQRAAG